jgi:riboflavin kinase/FMN adenylyltransferase
MRLIRGLHNLCPRHHGSVVTVGNFDGVHLGHQAIIAQVVEKARETNSLATVMLFEPQPVEFFTPEQAPVRIMPLRDKFLALATCGIDQLLCVRFDAVFSSLSAQDFVDHILVDGLGTRHLVVGDDFHFGAGREGNFVFLQQAGEKANFSVSDTPSMMFDGERVSSTRIRAALQQQDFALASRLLGRPYCITGRVRYGDQLGRTLDCPTANLALSMLHAPVAGIYVVRVSGAGLENWPGVASCGTRPTVNGQDNRLEVHLLDYSGNLYGKHLNIEMVRFLRPEQHFDGLASLKAAIDDDIRQARLFFQNQK